jgi:hypothetical protein
MSHIAASLRSSRTTIEVIHFGFADSCHVVVEGKGVFAARCCSFFR